MQVEDFCFLNMHKWLSLLDNPPFYSFGMSDFCYFCSFGMSNSRKTSPRVCHVEEFIYLSVAKKKGASQTYDTPSSLYKSLSISKVIHVYIYIMYCSILTCSS